MPNAPEALVAVGSKPGSIVRPTHGGSPRVVAATLDRPKAHRVAAPSATDAGRPAGHAGHPWHTEHAAACAHADNDHRQRDRNLATEAAVAAVATGWGNAAELDVDVVLVARRAEGGARRA